MERYAPNAKDLASRDIVSRAMTVEIREGRGVGKLKDHIDLHLEHLGARGHQGTAAGIAETARIFAGVDVNKEPIPVLADRPLQYGRHSLQCAWRGRDARRGGEKPVPGLMAIGEAACVSVHGANRLGLQFPARLGRFRTRGRARIAATLSAGIAASGVEGRCGRAPVARLDKLRHANGSRRTAEIRLNMQRMMQSDAAVFRTGETLNEGKRKLAEVFASFSDVRSAIDR